MDISSTAAIVRTSFVLQVLLSFTASPLAKTTASGRSTKHLMMMLSTEGQVLAPLLLREHFPRVLCIECIVDNADCALEELLSLLALVAAHYITAHHS